jgi:F-type H+-transporting ATPase subunit epsilon
MAIEKLELEIVTPDRLVLSESVDDVVLPGTEGYLGVLPGHAPLLTALTPGEISYGVKGRRHLLAVSGGFAEVLRSRVSVLAEACERADEIDIERARHAKERAETVLKSNAAEAEFRRAEVKLKRAVARIQVHGRGVA